jgi:uncharacterized protein
MNAVHRSLRSVGAPVRMILIGCIKVYRVTLSGWLGGQCRFYPSCSRYAEEAIRVHGAVRGSSMALWRVVRCNPFGAGGIDQVHGSRGSESYDDVVRRAADQKARV